MKNDTFKIFREWLKEQFVTGCPSENDWETILKEDEDFNYDMDDNLQNYLEDEL